MTVEVCSFDQFSSYFPVSRGTYVKLESYVSLLEKWQKSINLISNTTLSQIWNRHIIDSYQLVKYASTSDVITDIGCGAGLPGLILAIAGYKVNLVESDGKKVAFLREAVRVLELPVTIYHQRIENIILTDTTTVTARACATVSVILSMIIHALTPSHNVMLLKGKNFESEVAEAREAFQFDLQTYPSITAPSGIILLLTHIQPRGVRLS